MRPRRRNVSWRSPFLPRGPRRRGRRRQSRSPKRHYAPSPWRRGSRWRPRRYGPASSGEHLLSRTYPDSSVVSFTYTPTGQRQTGNRCAGHDDLRVRCSQPRGPAHVPRWPAAPLRLRRARRQDQKIASRTAYRAFDDWLQTYTFPGGRPLKQLTKRGRCRTRRSWSHFGNP